MSTPHVESASRHRQQPLTSIRDEDLTAKIEPFDSFWEAPADIERGYRSFGKFYEHNYLSRVPADRQARILVISCGPGYFVNLLVNHGYQNVVGIDSFPEKVRRAQQRRLACRVARLFAFLNDNKEPYDLIFAEQEINHLTKREILAFLRECHGSLRPGGTLIIHSINGANPLTGSESRAGNFDHYNSFTEYSLKQILEYSGFANVQILPLNLYVFYANPLNYLALAIQTILSFLFRLNFMLVGKSARIFTKKIAAVARKPQ
jgi:2-polyprenyl-3-methyl-5-hydroxy-6-metoxy-1,4-benzoquinol methylase